MFKSKLAAMGVFLSVLSFPFLASAVPPGKSLTWPDGDQGQVIFKGKEHAEKGYKCDACHPKLFQMKKGADKITMEAMNNGQFCGACHNGNTAFSTKDPNKCHECHKGVSKKEYKEHREERHHDHDD